MDEKEDEKDCTNNDNGTNDDNNHDKDEQGKRKWIYTKKVHGPCWIKRITENIFVSQSQSKAIAEKHDGW